MITAPDAESKNFSNIRFINSAAEQPSLADLDSPDTLPPSRLLCDELVLRSQGLLDAVHELVASATPDDAPIVVSRCHSRAAKVTDLLRELDECVSDRADFEWNNALGAARRNLNALREGLPPSPQSRQSKPVGHLKRSPLRKASLNLHKALVQLKELTG
jgi:hypothetical protein